jgi:predicted nucleic acid-binding protein
VTVTYLDTSAAMKLLIDEAESDVLVQQLTTTTRDLVASWLLHTELLRGSSTRSCTALPDETPL